MGRFFNGITVALVLTYISTASLGLAGQTSNAKGAAKGAPKAVELCGDDSCCDDDAAKPAADAKTAKATEQKTDAAKKDATRP